MWQVHLADSGADFLPDDDGLPTSGLSIELRVGALPAHEARLPAPWSSCGESGDTGDGDLSLSWRLRLMSTGLNPDSVYLLLYPV